MNIRLRHKILLLACSLAIGLVAGELLVRCLGRSTSDGNFYIGSKHLRPYHIPVQGIRKAIGDYLARPTSYIMYDPVMGWTPRPGSRSVNGLYRYDREGIRTGLTRRDISKNPRMGTLRIAIFGDSFTHADDVPFEETWGYCLEQDLKRAGIEAEVLNLGVGAYGMDQAYLRWKYKGRLFSPHIVILGFQAENVKRNVNLIRALYFPETGIPFAKPRFVIEGDALRLINVPTPDPAQFDHILDHILSWPLLRYEYWISPENYAGGMALKSRLASLVLSALDRPGKRGRRTGGTPSIYALGGEPAMVTIAIIKAFRDDVASTDARFYIVHLPMREDLKLLLQGAPLPYAPLLEKIEAEVPVIHAEQALLRAARGAPTRRLYRVHYTTDGNRVIAEAISEFLITSRAAGGRERPHGP